MSLGETHAALNASLGPVAHAGTAGPAPQVAQPSTSRWRELLEAIKKAKKVLDDARDIIGDDEGPLGANTDVVVAALLDEAEDSIDQILDPDVFPSLDPPDAGSPYLGFIPDTLPTMADYTADLAADAYDEAQLKEVADEVLIGSKLKTIKYLLPLYRTLAGIEP